MDTRVQSYSNTPRGSGTSLSRGGSLKSSRKASFISFDRKSKTSLRLAVKPGKSDHSNSLYSTSDTWSNDDAADTSSYSQIIPRLQGGTLIFQSDTLDDLKSEYIVIDKDTTMEDVGVYMSFAWKLVAPKVVVSVISNHEYYMTTSENIKEDFLFGLIEAARLTNMLVLTEGVNKGVSKNIGEAVRLELRRRSALGEEDAGSDVPLVVIGVVPSNNLIYGETIEKEVENGDQKIVIFNEGADDQELNPHHTHFVILKGSDQADKEAQWNIRFGLETKLANYLTRKQRRKETWSQLVKEEASYIPVVAILIQGGPNEIERVLWLLKKQIPVVVIARKGYASGLLAYAYFEGQKAGDSQHVETIVKPQLMQQVKWAFPEHFADNDVARMQFRDKILECVKYSVQGDIRLLTIVDPSHTGVDLKELNKYLLMAIFNSQGGMGGMNTVRMREKLDRNLRLTVDWNRPDLAASKIIKKLEVSQYKVKEELFLEALLMPDREKFVELFLDMGIALHRFLSLQRLLFLYENSLDNEFFARICLEKVLYKRTPTLGKNFLEGMNCQLNKLLVAVTGLQRQINPNQLSVAHLSMRLEEKQTAERKALLALIYWAALTNRKELAKVLWKRTTEPIAVALCISNLYYRLSKNWITDVDLQKRTKQAAVEFGALAIEVMDLVFNDSSIMAYHSLITPISDFNNLNVVDLALIGNNKFFIAHPCCQSSMRERWMGKMKIRSFGIPSFSVPEFVKIYLCLFLVFPIYFWLTFDTRKQRPVFDGDDLRGSREDVNNSSSSVSGATDSSPRKQSYTHHWVDPYATPPLWRKIYYLWTAPVAKFWLNQLFLVAYLVLYAVALLFPYCGNYYINSLLFQWTVIMFVEKVLTLIKKKLKYPTLELFWYVLDIFMEFCLIVVLFIHVAAEVNWAPSFLLSINFMTHKFLLSIGMLFTYYRALRYILPVSRDMGPMLVNITELTRRDLFNWLRLWGMCLLSGALAIHFVIYPAQTFTPAILWKAIMRALLGLFLTEVEDLDGDSSCTALYNIPEIGYTCNASHLHPYVRYRLETCPYSSWAGYVMVIQYLLISRQVFYTLMFAMFSVTTNRTRERSVEIWKYQFYSLVTDFERRPVLPVPLTPITYPFRILAFIGKMCLAVLFRYCFCCKRKPKVKKGEITIPYNQWKSYLSAIAKKEEESEIKIEDFISQLEEVSSAHQLLTKRLNDSLVNVEKNQTMTGFVLETLIKSLEALDPKTAQKGPIRQAAHTLSRSSPYPGTDKQRFPVLEKDVPWEVKFESYDPILYTKPLEEYPPEIQMYTDPDVLKLPAHAEEKEAAPAEEGGVFTQLLQFEPQYNTVQKLMLPTGKEISIDRVSWMTYNDNPLIYEIDATGVPRNPMGRSGVRGRGNLWRWGPNQMIQAVISRWKSAISGTASSGNLQTDASQAKRMEILVISEGADPKSICLPGGPVIGEMTAYSVMSSFIMKDVFCESDPDISPSYDQDDMIEYFSQFASADLKKKSKSMYATFGYSAYLVYRGYSDDPANTDNAWKEAQIWNFHYKYKDSFENRFTESEVASWVTASSTMPLSPSELTAVNEAAKIHNAFF